MNSSIGKSICRKDAWDKVTGRAKYTDDFSATGVLHAKLLTSTHSHALIKKIDCSKALNIKGVVAVLTGESFKELHGPLLQDRPALARDVVRYSGEPVALVVAVDEPTAEEAVRLIEVEYETLPFVLTPTQALSANAPLIHKQANGYKKVMIDVYPEEGTNIASRYHMKKGDTTEAFKKCKHIVEQHFYLPPSEHMAMEVRACTAEISSDGNVIITTSSQSPFAVRKQLSEAFLIPSGKIQIKVPYVGGGFGGKAPTFLEILAYIASRSVGGKAVHMTIPREHDIQAAPCRMGLEADIKIGVDEKGFLQAAELKYFLDCGAYADISPYMAKATAMDCTGPYNIENLSCESLCIYTNHTYATSFRGFSHESFTFCIERAMDMLAEKCSYDPIEFRIKNAIRPGCLTPSQVLCTKSLIGDLPECLEKLKILSDWDGKSCVLIKKDTVRAKGVSCLWKIENPPVDAISGVIVTCNPDGSFNLNTGVVEIGANGKTHLAQMIAEKLKIDADQVHVKQEIDTMVTPEHWKTVASITEYMAGHAAVRAAEDLLDQLRKNGSLALECPYDDIEVSNGRVFSKKNPEKFIEFKNIVQGYKTTSGQSVGEPVIGRGGYKLKGLSLLDKQTGQGKTGTAWTVGAQVVEIEANVKTFTYRIINASTVIDIGNLINPESIRSMVAGGMAMGLSLSSRESLKFNKDGIQMKPNLRTYKLLHIGQEPDYRVDFVETPETQSPFGVRSYAEHGVIGMSAALGNAISSAFGKQITTLPLTPESIWTSSSKNQQG